MDKRIFFDIGCNKGYYTSIWMQDPNNTIYAFEPEPYLFKELVNKFSENKNVHIFDYAISEVDGESPFYVHHNLCNSSLKKTINLDLAYDEASTIMVKTRRIDSLISELNIESIDLIKSDTQGSDLEVIKSIGDKFFMVKRIMAEAFLNESNNMYENEVKESQLVEYLSGKGFGLISKSVDGNYADFIFYKK